MSNQVITMFLDGTTCDTLVHRIGRVKPKTTRKLLDLATDDANGEEVVVFSKRKREEDPGKVLTTRPDNKKEKERKPRDDNLVAAADRRPAKPWGGPPKDHFEKLLEAPCPNHEEPIKHALKDSNLMTNFIGRLVSHLK
jgi:hypothetical protein